MAQSQSSPDGPKSILQPPCPQCSAPMWLVQLSAVDHHHDLRVFECKVCDHRESMKVKFR